MNLLFDWIQMFVLPQSFYIAGISTLFGTFRDRRLALKPATQVDHIYGQWLNSRYAQEGKKERKAAAEVAS